MAGPCELNEDQKQLFAKAGAFGLADVKFCLELFKRSSDEIRTALSKMRALGSISEQSILTAFRAGDKILRADQDAAIEARRLGKV